MRRIAAQNLDGTGAIEVARVPLGQVKPLVLRDDIRVAGSVALCLLALRRLRH